LAGLLSTVDHVLRIALTRWSSGIQGSWMRYSWFSTSFDVPSDWTGERTHLNFGAVDYEAWVYINGQYAGFNRGGYFHFTVDVTDHLSTNGTNEL
jgi:beta-galactosidase/beta-glucuronidase